MKRLPNKVSKLVKLAIADLEWVERSKRYSIKMCSWFPSKKRPIQEGNCSMCLAGAVMLRSLDARKLKKQCPSEFPRSINGKLLALDHLRCGSIDQFLESVGLWGNLTIHRVRILKAIHIPEYRENPILFKENMLRIASSLESWGY